MLKHPYKHEYIRAIEKEIDGLYSKGTFTSLEHTTEKLLPLIWVWTNKYDENGYLEQFKARLVARGDLVHSYEEVYAATLAA